MNNHLSPAVKLTPVIERVHGAHHPELTRVRELTHQVSQASDPAEIANLFHELRSVTDNYSIPGDAGEAFTATYASLQKADDAFQAVV